MNDNLAMKNMNDGSDAAPRLECYLNMGNAGLSDSPDGSVDGLYAAIKAAGYTGTQCGEPDLCKKHGLGNTGVARVNAVGEVEGVIKGSMDAGHECCTLHVAWGLEDDAEVDRIVRDILSCSVEYSFPVYIETHRATITDDLWRTVKLVERHPGIRFNGDFSHWYTGHEMVYGGIETKMDFIQPVFERVRFMHGRIGNPGCIQVGVGDGSGGVGFEFVDHFKEMWTRSMTGFLRSAQPGDYFVFAPELLGPEIYYARTFPDPVSGQLREETNRWEQALVLVQIARSAWTDALKRV